MPGGVRFSFSLSYHTTMRATQKLTEKVLRKYPNGARWGKTSSIPFSRESFKTENSAASTKRNVQGSTTFFFNFFFSTLSAHQITTNERRGLPTVPQYRREVVREVKMGRRNAVAVTAVVLLLGSLAIVDAQVKTSFAVRSKVRGRAPWKEEMRFIVCCQPRFFPFDCL